MEPMEITPELLASLKDKAKAATPGPWLPITCSNSYEIRTRLTGRNFAYAYTRPDGEYIAAASPDVVLALIARIQELEKDLDGLCHEDEAKQLVIAHLEKEADWLAARLQRQCNFSCGNCAHEADCHNNNWRQAARKAVEEDRHEQNP